MCFLLSHSNCLNYGCISSDFTIIINVLLVHKIRSECYFASLFFCLWIDIHRFESTIKYSLAFGDTVKDISIIIVIKVLISVILNQHNDDNGNNNNNNYGKNYDTSGITVTTIN